MSEPTTVERLKAENAVLREQNSDLSKCNAYFARTNLELRRRAKAAEAALRECGEHHHGCRQAHHRLLSTPCDCGLDALLATEEKE
jgi:hypothetical protein